MNDKSLMRAAVLERRDAIPEEERARRSEKICRDLACLAKAFCPCEAKGAAESPPLVAAYAAMRSEVNLDAFVRDMQTRGWTVCFPCMVRDRSQQKPRMEFFRVPPERMSHARRAFLSHPLCCFSSDELDSAGYALAEPRDLDFVAVPLVAFDRMGGRLGYGGGNYDRLLPKLRPDALAVGVAFVEQRVRSVPRDHHDVPLSRVISA
ncbi:5-formyltetrahydrofolate cyclo-ligase [Gordonibacter sp. An230]|uniref:5-formyltetrahydrofolate cyclo-ligase n=1 Tax=Gordonibacter sp. An230 TaxID=1965592 RepID=UPI0013A65E53|nr:5-formyltetrahydrofolate cyclo-ligase [Gordonibacter sp. An230]